MRPLRILFEHLDRFRSTFFAVFLAGVLDRIAMFFFPLVLAEYSRGTLTLEDFPRVCFYLVMLYFVSLALQWVLRRHGEALGAKYAIYLRLKYFRALEALPAPAFSKFHSGYILSLVSRVADGLGSLAVEMFWGVAKSLANMLLFFIFTARESAAIAWANFALLTIFIAVSTYLSRRMVPIAQDLNVRRAGLMGRYADFTANILTVKKLSIRNFAESRLGLLSTENEEGIDRFQRFHAWRWMLLHSLYGAAYLLTICFLLREVAAGRNSPAVLILFIATFSTVRGHVERLSEDFKNVLELNAFIRTLDEFVTPNRAEVAEAKHPSWTKIAFGDVVFQHPGNAKRIRIPSFEITQRETISVSGSSGEGKSTFLNILANFLEPQEGKRLVDTASYAEVPPSFFHSSIALVSQEVELFNLSLRENILLGGTLEDEKLLELLDELDLKKWALDLDEGLDTIVGEKGMKLSSGQKQRVNLVRAVLLDRPLYLLDEPTAHLDQATERKVVEFLQRHLQGRTAVVVSHRPAMKELATQHYVMRGNTLLKET